MNGQIDNRKILNMCQVLRNKVDIYTYTHTQPQRSLKLAPFVIPLH